jgi:methyl-accepting chemotaxis protein
MRSFFRFENIPASSLVAVAWASSAVALAGLLSGHLQVVQAGTLTSLLVGLVLFISVTQREGARARVLGKIASVCKEVAQGNFEARLTHISEKGELAEAQKQVNDVVDRCDAFVREATASLETVCRGLYYRRILEGGLQGAFLVAANAINDAVDAQGQAVETARREAAEQHAHLLALLATALRNLSDGNLTFRLGEFPEAYRQVKDDFNTALDKLEAALQGVRHGTDTMAAGTTEIATASADLARRTEMQAANLEETAAAIEQLSQTINQAAESTGQTKDQITAARADAEKSADVVRQTIGAMGKIRDSSQRINGIVGVIDEIAFQTNLLALNAGVEAARAGESGRGFAVVATEVRALAGRSAVAAKEIKDLISQSSREVDAGVELAQATGGALDRMMNQFRAIENGFADIAFKALDRATTVKQVNMALEEIDRTTQQNAAMAEEATAACQSLADESQALLVMVGQFRVSAEQVDVPANSHDSSSSTLRPAA